MIRIVLLSQKIVQIFKSDFRQFPVDLLPIRMPIWWFSKLHRAFHWFILSGCKLAIASNCYQLPRHHCKISAKTLLDLGSKLDFVKSKDGRWDMRPPEHFCFNIFNFNSFNVRHICWIYIGFAQFKQKWLWSWKVWAMVRSRKRNVRQELWFFGGDCLKGCG